MLGDYLGYQLVRKIKPSRFPTDILSRTFASFFGEFSAYKIIPLSKWVLMPGLMLSNQSMNNVLNNGYCFAFDENIYLGPYFQARYRHNATWQHSFIVSYMPFVTFRPYLNPIGFQIWKFTDQTTGYYAYRIDHHRWFASLEWRKLYHFKPLKYYDRAYGGYLTQTYWLNPNKWSLHIGYAIRLSKKR
jgi:hypothetical protein